MRWTEIVSGNPLLEGATFYPSQVYNAGSENEHHGWPRELVKKVVIDCQDCDGTGKDRDQACVYCQGTGKETEEKWEFPSLDVSYDNMRSITDMMGLEDEDSSGMIWHKDIPGIIRRLIVLKNKDSSRFTQEPSQQQDRRVTQNDDGVTQISMGPKMYHGGRNQAQIDRYIDSMMEILTFAQKNNMNVTWA